MNDRKFLLAASVNIIIAVLGIIGDVMEIAHHGIGMLAYYTVDSNILSQIACIVCAVYYLRKKELSNNAGMLKYMSVCMLFITFVVVVTMLAPMKNSGGLSHLLLDDALLYHHLLCPILAFVSYIVFDKRPEFKHNVLIATIPTVIYAFITTLLNIAKIMHGPYPFLYVYEQPFYASILWAVAIFAVAFILAFITDKIKNRKK